MYGIAPKIAQYIAFTAIRQVVVTIKATADATAAAVIAISVAAAGLSFSTAILAVALEINAVAVNERVVRGAPFGTAAVLAGFVCFTSGIAIAAVFGIALNVDAVAFAPQLVCGTSAGFCFAAAVGTDEIHITGIATGTTVIAIVMGINTDAVATRVGTAGMAAQLKTRFTLDGIGNGFGIIIARGAKTGECQTYKRIE